MEKSHPTSPEMDRMRESTESWEVLSVPSASGRETEETMLVSTAQYNSTQAKKSASMERLLFDAQKESLQNSARQSLYQSKRSSPMSPDSPTESGDCNEEFERQMLDPVNADGSTDWIWEWHNTENGAKVLHRVRRVIKKPSSLKTHFWKVLILTNVLALVIGAGLGYFLSSRISSAQIMEDNEWDILSSMEPSFRFN
ncbi:hypothetical protein RvY_10021 [Ramazzottius varieornatus]|uniref:BCL2/adenovirus E1B 19 kDa protein-interacting protein 3 n=1 Tax=Ramazzottius varieornatus TaxID=947166 RepID=A0A1D1VBC5_RAMVA|nr:hypothetical protein RvY_10021 [Ramazzottius varieornatus]